MDRDDGLREANGDRFKYVYKVGAQGMPGALISLLAGLPGTGQRQVTELETPKYNWVTLPRYVWESKDRFCSGQLGVFNSDLVRSPFPFSSGLLQTFRVS